MTVRAIRSLRASDYPSALEILVYDNASPEGPGEVADLDGVTLVQGAENIGFGPAHDILANEATGDLLLVMNNDVVVSSQALGRMVERLLSSDSIGAVAPSYRNFDGTQLEMGGFVGGSGDGWQLFRLTRPPESLTRMPLRAHYGSAAFLLLRRADFIDRGGFDDRFAPAYYEDTDLCFDLANDGKATIVEPSAVVFHYEGATAGIDTTSGFKQYQPVNQIRFIKKWKSQLSGRPAASFPYALGEALFYGDTQRVLWACPHLPRPDREAGYARVVRMVEALNASGAKVALWAEHAHDAERYGRMLEDAGVPWFALNRPARWPLDVAQPAVLRSFEELLASTPWSAIVVSFPELADRLLPIARANVPRVPVLVDDVDLHFLRLERAVASGLDVPGELHMAKEKELGIYARSDGVIVASDVEESILKAEIVGLPVFTFPVAAESGDPVAAAHPAGKALFLGNMVHEPNRDAVDWWVSDVAPSHSGSPVLRVVGTGSEMHAAEWEASKRVEVAGWVEDLEDEFRGARLFVAPIRFGAGTKGKFMTAIRFGLPIVTTTVGAEGNPEAMSACMVVEDDPDRLAAAVVRLMSDDAEWRKRSDAATELARTAIEDQRILGHEFADWVGRRKRMFPKKGPVEPLSG